MSQTTNGATVTINNHLPPSAGDVSSSLSTITTTTTDNSTSNNCTATASTTKASMRWKLLKNFLLNKKQSSNNESTLSVTRCVSSYGWLDQEECNDDSVLLDNDGYKMTSFTMKENNLSVTLRLRSETTMKDFDIANKDHVDNTGNVCVWPSEEILAHYCINYLKREFFQNKRVLEIGCGIGVGGLLIAKYFSSISTTTTTTPIIKEIVLTDGNASVIENLQFNIEQQYKDDKTNNGIISCSQLLWQDEKAIEKIGQFDVILAADCLFFESFHEDLVKLFKRVGKSDGGETTVIMFNPRRGKSLDNFLTILNQQCSHAIVKLEERYDEKTFEKHLSFLTTNPLYCKENHYPILMEIKL